MLLSARFASLDTSHWAGLCASLIEKPSRANALRRLRAVANEGWILAMSFHQVQELLAHENEQTAIARLAALRHVPTLAAVIGSTDDDVPGTVVDVQRLEILAVTADPGADADAVRAKVRGASVRTTTGDAIVDAVMPVAHVVRAHALARQERTRETASISQAKVLDQSRMPFFLDGVARPAANIEAHFNALQVSLAAELAKRGDARLTDPQASAANFIESLTQHQDALTSSSQPVVELLKLSGLTVADVVNVKNVGQLGELAHFQRNLEISSKGTGVAAEDLRHISQETLPTWVVHRALLRHRQVRPRVEGGDLTDGHLLSMAPYFDATFVDKRTNHDAGLIRQHDAAAGRWLANVRKASSWSRALDHLAAVAHHHPGASK